MADPNQNTPAPLASGQRLEGTVGRDVLTGGVGADVIEVGGGFGDLLTGGAGSDLFTFNGALANGRRDFTIIADYEVATADRVGDFIGLDLDDTLFMRAVGDRAFIYYGADFDVIVLNGVSNVDDIQFFPRRIEAALTGFGLGAIARVGVTPTMFHSLQDALDDAGTVSGATLEVGGQDAPLHAAVTLNDDTATVLTLTSVMGSGITLKAGDGANDLELTATTSGSATATLRAAALSGAHVTMGDGDNALMLTATAGGVGGGERSARVLTDGASLTLGHGANSVTLHGDATSTNGGQTVATALYDAEIAFGDGGNFLGVYLDSHKTGTSSDADIYAFNDGSRVTFGAGADTFLLVANASGDANADDVAIDGFKNASKLYMGAGDDTVTLTLTASTNGGNDHDLDDIEALDSGSLIDTGDGGDTVTITITASAYGPDAEVFATGVDDSSTIALGDGDNTFSLTITGYSADDDENDEDVEIYGFDNGSSLTAGGGNDTVTLTLTAEGGTDYIEVIGFRNSVVDLGDGTNRLALTGLANGTAAAGERSESYGFSSDSSFVGGDGADTLTLAMTAVSANYEGSRAAGVERRADIALGAGANALEITSAAVSTQNGSALAFGIRSSGTVVSGGDDGNRLALTVSADSDRSQAIVRGIYEASVVFGAGADTLEIDASATSDATNSRTRAFGISAGSVNLGAGDDHLVILGQTRNNGAGLSATVRADGIHYNSVVLLGDGDDIVRVEMSGYGVNGNGYDPAADNNGYLGVNVLAISSAGSVLDLGEGANTASLSAHAENVEGWATAHGVQSASVLGGSGADSLTLKATAVSRDTDAFAAAIEGGSVDLGGGANVLVLEASATSRGGAAAAVFGLIDDGASVTMGEDDDTLTMTAAASVAAEAVSNASGFGVDGAVSLGGGADTVTLNLSATVGAGAIAGYGGNAFINGVNAGGSLDLGEGDNQLVMTVTTTNLSTPGQTGFYGGGAFGYAAFDGAFVFGDGANTADISVVSHSAADGAGYRSWAVANGLDGGSTMIFGDGANTVSLSLEATGDGSYTVAQAILLNKVYGSAEGGGITMGDGGNTLTLTAAAAINGDNAAGSRIEAMGLVGGSSVTTGAGDDTIAIALTISGEVGGAAVTALGLGRDQAGNVPTLSTGAGDDVVTIAITDETTGVAASRRVAGVEGATIDLGDGDDRLILDSADDATLLGGAGDDVFEVGAGTATIVGGAGSDTLVLSGSRAEFRASVAAGDKAGVLTRIEGGDPLNGANVFPLGDVATDEDGRSTELTVSQIERFAFDDGIVTYDELFTIDVDTDVVALSAPLAARMLADLETTTPATLYDGPYRRFSDLEVSFENPELIIDFGFSGDEWEPVLLYGANLGILREETPGNGNTDPFFYKFLDQRLIETADAFYQLFWRDVDGYRIEDGKFIVSLGGRYQNPEDWVTSFSVANSFVKQRFVGEVLPAIDLSLDEFALVSSADSTLVASEIGDAAAVAALLNARYAFSASAADGPRSTIFAVTAGDDATQVAFWEHRQSQAGDASVTADELVPLGRFTTVNGELGPRNLASALVVPGATAGERNDYPDGDWALVDRQEGEGRLQNEDDADGQYARLVALDVLVERDAEWEISNQGVDDFLAALRTVRVEVTGNTDGTAQFDVSASNASGEAGPGTDFLGALESITVINSANGDVSVSLSVTGGDYFMQSLRSIHLETTSLDQRSADMSISNSAGSGLYGDHFMPALETITMVVPRAGSLSISNSGGAFFMKSLQSILVENLGETFNLSVSSSAALNDNVQLTGDHFMAALETITIRADGHQSSVSMSFSHAGGADFMASLKSITVENANETVELSISASANFVNEGGRGEHFMRALETITITSDGQDSSVSVDISHSGGAFFMQSLKAVVLEGREEVEMSLKVSHNFLGADNFEVMRSLETIVLKAGVDGKASLNISAEHTELFMASLKSVLVESEAANNYAKVNVQNNLDADAAANLNATRQGDDFMTALETITVRAQGSQSNTPAEVNLSNQDGDRFMDALHTIVAEGAGGVLVVLNNDNGHDFLGALESIEMEAGGTLELRFDNLAGDRYATALDGVALDGGGALTLSMSNQSGADFMTSFALIDLSGREAGSSSSVSTGGALDHALEVRVGGGDLTYDNGAVFDASSGVYTDRGNDAQETFVFSVDDDGQLTFGDVVIRGFDATSPDNGARVRDLLVFEAPDIAVGDLVFAVDAESDGRADLRITSTKFDGEIVLEGNFTDFTEFEVIAQTLWS